MAPQPLTSSSAALCAEHGAGEGLDAVRAEAGPVVVSGHDDRSLQVTQRHHVVPPLGVERDVDLVEGDALLLQRLVGRGALHAGGLGVNGDAHGGRSFAGEGEVTTNWQLLGWYVVATFSGPPSSQIPVLRLPGRATWRHRFREVHQARLAW